MMWSLPKPLSAHNTNFTFLSRTVFNVPFSISALTYSRFNPPEFPQNLLAANWLVVQSADA